MPPVAAACNKAIHFSALGATWRRSTTISVSTSTPSCRCMVSSSSGCRSKDNTKCAPDAARSRGRGHRIVAVLLRLLTAAFGTELPIPNVPALFKGMEKTMRRFTLLLLVVLLGGTDRMAAQETVETRGITSVIKIDEVIFGHLTELNGKFKLRATELTFAPDGYVGVHHHIGPGIRSVISVELTFAEGGQEAVYKAGEYFFETGNLAHTAQNKTNMPLRVLVVEILPKDWTAPAMIAPKSQ